MDTAAVFRGKLSRPHDGTRLLAAGAKVWVLHGFSGEELNDRTSEGVWALVETSSDKPSPRSVFLTFGIGKHIIVYGGEVNPIQRSRASWWQGVSLGKFLRWTLKLVLIWKRLEEFVDGCEHPGILVHGGNLPTNDRLDDTT